MATSLTFIKLQHVCQLLLSVWGLRHSFVAILNLHKYEASTKKLAEWSGAVEEQLRKTRTTQSAGCATVTLSLLTSTTLLTIPTYLNQWVVFAASPTMLLLTLLARNYIKNFWTPGGGASDTSSTNPNGEVTSDANQDEKKPKQKEKGIKLPLPGLGDYNVAVEATEKLLGMLEYLEYSWLITSVVVSFKGYNGGAGKVGS